MSAAQAPSIDDLRRLTLEATAGPLGPVTEDEDDAVASITDPKTAEEWTFDFSHKAMRGTTYSGKITNRILTTGESQQAASIAARLSGGVPYESLSPGSQILNEAIAHMSLSLWSRTRPGQPAEFRGPNWAKDLREVFDQDLILALWDKVTSHETTFFRLEPPQTGGT